MSDPVTNIEIEDVLSSIRRLVADTDASVDPFTAPKSHETVEDTRFVLTPALRISHAHKAKPESESHSDSGATSNVTPLVLGPDDAVAARASLEATIAELEAAVTAQPDEWELDGSEVKTEVTWESAGFVSRATREAMDDEPKEMPLEALVLTEDLYVDDTPEVAQADDVKATAPTVAEIFVDSGDDLTNNDTENDGAANADAAIVGDAPASFRRSSATTIDHEASDDHGDEMAQTTEPKIDPDAELETYLSGKPSIDEKLLRELVQQVVREELQGHLGERITRNVRKLVRREIHRVLTSQDFD